MYDWVWRISNVQIGWQEHWLFPSSQQILSRERAGVMLNSLHPVTSVANTPPPSQNVWEMNRPSRASNLTGQWWVGNVSTRRYLFCQVPKLIIQMGGPGREWWTPEEELTLTSGNHAGNWSPPTTVPRPLPMPAKSHARPYFLIRLPPAGSRPWDCKVWFWPIELLASWQSGNF